MSFRELSELVSSGKLRLIHIEGVRRTISTALEIALTEAADGQINEPFDRGNNNFEGACEEIAKRAAMLGANERGGNNPLLLLVKNTCPMSADDWQRYIGVVDNFVTITRDPQQQLHSMMEQKGKVVGRSLRVEFSPQDYQAYESILFFQTFTDEWQRFSERHTLLQEHLATNLDKRHVIVDGGLLKVQPEHTLREITQQLQLPADEATIQAMAFNRTKAAGQKFYDTAIDQLKASGLVDDALSGRAFTPQASHDLPFRVFGERAQSHLVDVAIPIHTGLLRDAKMLRPKTVAEVSALSQMPVGNGKTFGEENSPLCYTLAATAEDEGRPEEKHRLLSAVRKQHAVDNGQAFDAINQLTGVYVIQYVEKKMGFGHRPDNLNYWEPYNSHQIYHADKEKPLVFYFGGIPIMSRQQAPEKSICDEVLSYLKDFKKDDYQLLIVSERPTTNKHELGEKYNNDPQQFYTSNAAEFVQSMLLPLIKESQTLND